MTANSRQAILDRVRAGTHAGADAAQLAAGYAAIPRTYIRRGGLDPASRIALMIHRLREYDAEVVECAPSEIAAIIAAQIAASGRSSFVAPPGLQPEWLFAGTDTKIEWKIDHGLSTDEVERADGVLTTAFCGIADSGTIVLHHSAQEGRRVLTLLPDWHLCVLRASQVVETLPEYFARCSEAAQRAGGAASAIDTASGPPPLATFISGPSATADIEMTRIKGVHGPRFLQVILVRDETK